MQILVCFLRIFLKIVKWACQTHLYSGIKKALHKAELKEKCECLFGNNKLDLFIHSAMDTHVFVLPGIG